MKITTSEVGIGTILNLEGGLYKVVDMTHTHTGRWGATDTFKVKEITTGKTKQVTYHAGAVLDKAEIEMKSSIYLYKAGQVYSFMENDTGEMHDLDESKIDDITGYLKENLDLYLMKYEGNILSVLLPSTIQYKITSTVEGIKGDRATAGTKPATIETGMEVQVPLHKKEGDVVTVNTTTGKVS